MTFYLIKLVAIEVAQEGPFLEQK